MKRIAYALVVCAIACMMLINRSGAQTKAADLSGTWRIHFQDDDGVSTSAPKLVLERTGDKLTGTFGKFDWPVIGAVDGNRIVFTFVAFGHEGGKTISDTVFYWGTIDETGTMKGRMKNPKEAGDWVAAKE
jgi:hypothetical protein